MGTSGYGECSVCRFAAGRDEVAQFFGQMAEVQDVVEYQPEEFIAQGDTVVVLGRFTMHVKATGKDSRSRWAHVWKVENGRASYVREYVDTLAVSQAHGMPNAAAPLGRLRAE